MLTLLDTSHAVCSGANSLRVYGVAACDKRQFWDSVLAGQGEQSVAELAADCLHIHVRLSYAFDDTARFFICLARPAFKWGRW